MKKIFLTVIAMFFAISMLPMTVSAEVNGGMNTYLSVSGYDMAIQSASQDVYAPGFDLSNTQDAAIGALNGMAGVNQYTDYTREPDYTVVNTETDASAVAGLQGVAGANSNNSTMVFVPEAAGFTNNTIDLSVAFGGVANGSSNSSIVIIGN